MINFSIIIPHYNIPQLLVRCVRSIPVREDIQVIVVDDCSPNADGYLSCYPELSRPYLEFYSTPKGGSAGRARNIGLQHAKGRWLIFVDADDILPEDIEQTFDQYVDRPEDVVLFDYVSVMNDNLELHSERDPKYHKLICNYLKDQDEGYIRYTYDPLWGKWVKKSLVDAHGLRFDETRWGNDGYFSLSVGIHAKTLLVQDKVAYILTQREGSLAGNFCGTTQEVETRLKVALKMQSLLVKHNLPVRYSRVPFISYIMNRDYSRFQALCITLKCWKYPRFMLLELSRIIRNLK